MINIIMASISILSVCIGVFVPIFSSYMLKNNKSEMKKNRYPKPLRRKFKRKGYKLRNIAPVVLPEKKLYCRIMPSTINFKKINLENGNLSKIKVDDTTIEISIPDRDEIISVLEKYNRKGSN